MHRRALLLGALLPALGACTTLPALTATASTAEGQALLDAGAAAHGGAALAGVNDISLSYAGTGWSNLVDRLQPELVDASFRGGSEERLLLRAGVVAQAHAGPAGRKQVVRRTAAGGQGAVTVRYNDGEVAGADRRSVNLRAGAALVVDAYSLFLLGPMVLAGPWAGERSLVLATGEPERIRVDGVAHECDVLRVRVAPGIGFSEADDLLLWLDKEERLMRRIRFSLNGMEGTRGAVAETDAAGHMPHGGVRWPTRFVERLLRPLPAFVHEWRLRGLDLNRGLQPADVSGPAFTGRAAAPAAAWA